jgi:hypothetical protein
MRSLLAPALALLLLTSTAHAFCGFYVGGTDDKLFNNATQVVLMRKGTRTVLSMQNNYQGPPSGFAMVVPVPVVLHQENVKTLKRAVFSRVEQLAAPRLVEYWEQDPCATEPDPGAIGLGSIGTIGHGSGAGGGYGRGATVKIEAEFAVGEYDIVILSAEDSTGLDTWLRANHYKIPDGAEPLLRPYVQAGMKFFVAKVDPTKVKFVNGQAMLSPLRFHYDTDQFSLPVRLGLVNSAGTQDLIVNILAPNQRYEVANYPNATIPTNIDVADSTRDQFGSFYASLFDRALEKYPKAAITEYAWDSGTCDPCPVPGLTEQEVLTLGKDVLPPDQEDDGSGSGNGYGTIGRRRARGLTLTRLHVRYGKDSLGEDLVFRAAPPIIGGREEGGPQQSQEAKPSQDLNAFQARYVIRHRWPGPVSCQNPRRGRWGGPPPSPSDVPMELPIGTTHTATNVAFQPRGLELASFLVDSVPVLGLAGAPTRAAATPAPVDPPPGSQRVTQPPESTGCRVAPGAPATGVPLALLVLLSWIGACRSRSRRGTSSSSSSRRG